MLTVGTHIAVNPSAARVCATKERSTVGVEINLARTVASN
jgi:hypothetical protein